MFSVLHRKVGSVFTLSKTIISNFWTPSALTRVLPVLFVISIFLSSPYSVWPPNRSPPGAATKLSQKETSRHGAWTSTTCGLFWQTEVVFLYFTGISFLSSPSVLPRAPCLFLKWNRFIKICQLEHFWSQVIHIVLTFPDTYANGKVFSPSLGGAAWDHYVICSL